MAEIQLMVGALVEVRPDELLVAFQLQQQATCEAVPMDPRTWPGLGVVVQIRSAALLARRHEHCQPYRKAHLRFAWVLICCHLSRVAICVCVATVVRERENFLSPFSQHWLMRMRLDWSHQPS